MPKTKAQIIASNNYAKKAYDDIRLQVKKGKKELIKQRAESLEMSIQGYINHLIDQDMNRD